MFGRAKTGGLGQVTTKKWKIKKTGITRPRPDGGVIILRNRAEYHLILSRRGRRPSWLNQGIFRKIEQDNCFIIQQIPIDDHFQNEKNYGSMIKTLNASNT